MLRKRVATGIGWVLLISIPALAQVDSLSKAEELYSQAQYHASLSLLDTHARAPALLFLIGRDYYMLGEFKKATEYLGEAVIAAPKNSDYMDWLGRTYKLRAETSNPLSAVVLARRAKEKFERAVQLNPKNAEALSDLFEYYLQAPLVYLQAPLVLGGRYEKADAVAEKMSAVDPSEAVFEKTELAQKRHQFQTDRPALRNSVALALKSVGALVSRAGVAR